MCCFPFGIFNLKVPCPGKGCSCWFVLSMLFSIIVFALMIAFEVYLDHGDGQFPVYAFTTFTGLLYTSNVISFLTCLGCIFLICTESKRLALAILAEVGLVFSFCITVYCLYFICYGSPSDRVTQYTADFFNRTGRAPPLLDYVQEKARVTIPIPGNPEHLGCCGSHDFHDYANSSKRLQSGPNGSDYLFDVPDTCCKDIYKGCGSNLHYSYHYSEIKFIEKAIRLATEGGDGQDATVTDLVIRILDKYSMDLDHIQSDAEAEANRTDSHMSPVTLFIPIDALPALLSPDEIGKLKKQLDDFQDLLKTVKDLKEKLERFQMNRETGVKIHVIGCNRIFNAICYGCVVAFAVIKTITDALTILALNCYFFRLYCVPDNPITED